MQNHKAIMLESFSVAGRGVLVEMQHSENGLKQGTILHSIHSGLSWEIKSRVLFDHVMAAQKIFVNETISFMLLKFASTDKREESINNIKQKEASNIFQYMISPLGHEQKPEKEELLIRFSDLNQ
jgi:hypothetical protein